VTRFVTLRILTLKLWNTDRPWPSDHFGVYAEQPDEALPQ
jgi:hypothetical protein